MVSNILQEVVETSGTEVVQNETAGTGSLGTPEALTDDSVGKLVPAALASFEDVPA